MMDYYGGSPDWAVVSLNFMADQIYDAKKDFFRANRFATRGPQIVIYCGSKHFNSIMYVDKGGRKTDFGAEFLGARVYHVVGAGDLFFDIRAIPMEKLSLYPEMGPAEMGSNLTPTIQRSNINTK